MPYISFGERLNALPKSFRHFLVGVGLFGAGDFAHSMLILLAVQTLTPEYGAGRTAVIATALYVLHNIFYASFSFFAGWLADHVNKRALLSGGYALAALMGLVFVFVPLNLPTLAVVFTIGGIYVAIEEALEDTLTAELVT